MLLLAAFISYLLDSFVLLIVVGALPPLAGASALLRAAQPCGGCGYGWGCGSVPFGSVPKSNGCGSVP